MVVGTIIMITRRTLILEYIKNYIREHGYAPSIREICKGTGISSTSTVQGYLQSLFDGGILETDLTTEASRAYRISKKYLSETEEEPGTYVSLINRIEEELESSSGHEYVCQDGSAIETDVAAIKQWWNVYKNLLK